jgi:hypothetical protein
MGPPPHRFDVVTDYGNDSLCNRRHLVGRYGRGGGPRRAGVLYGRVERPNELG